MQTGLTAQWEIMWVQCLPWENAWHPTLLSLSTSPYVQSHRKPKPPFREVASSGHHQEARRSRYPAVPSEGQ